MPGPITTNQLLSEVRAQTDESNSDTVSDADIYAALNRAQRKAANVLAKKFPDLFLTYTTITADATSLDTYPIPVAAYGRRVNSITVVRSFIEYPVRRVEHSALHNFASSTQVRLPSVYALQGRNIIIRPVPTPGVVFKVWYSAAPEPMVASQGRITAVSVGSNYVVLDSLGSSLSTNATDLTAYVNIVDAQTGQIKATMQTSSLTTATSTLTFKSSALSAATVYGRTISTVMPSTNVSANANVNVNDYVCAVQGVCVPDLPDSCLDFTVQYAVNDLKRRLGLPVSDDKVLLDDLEADVEHQWAGREVVARIQNRSRVWTR